jgi:hypothetical protein
MLIMNQPQKKLGAKRHEDEIPDFILRFLANMPLMPGEAWGDYQAIYHDFVVELDPKSVLDHYQVYESCTLTYELFRYHCMKIAISNTPRHTNAVRSLFSNAGTAVPKVSLASAPEALAAAIEAAPNPATIKAEVQKAAPKESVQAGYSLVETHAFVQGLPSLVRIETLIASAQKRLNSYLKELIERKDIRAAKIKRLAERTVAAAATRPAS